MARCWWAATPSASRAGANTPGITRLNTDGSLDASFAGSVNRATSSAVKTIIVQGDGKILLGGFFSQVDGVASNNLARLNTDGTLDGTFVPAAAPASFLAALQPDGKVLIGSESAPGLIRLNSDGSVDATFHYAGTDASYVYTGSPNLAALEPGGQIVLYDYASGTLSRVNADGSADTGFHPAANGVVDAVVPQADGTVGPRGRLHPGQRIRGQLGRPAPGRRHRGHRLHARRDQRGRMGR